jgi:hypothetical protein
VGFDFGLDLHAGADEVADEDGSGWAGFAEVEAQDRSAGREVVAVGQEVAGGVTSARVQPASASTPPMLRTHCSVCSTSARTPI